MSVMESRSVMNAFAKMAPTMTWFMNLPIGRDPAVMRTECTNKCKIMTLVNGLANYSDGKATVQQMVEKAYSLGQFAALWAVEGIGKDLCETQMNQGIEPKRLLTDAKLDAKWDGAWLMLHAGLGMGVARPLVQKLGSSPSAGQTGDMAAKVVRMCKENSRPGYAGAAIESLGLVSRFMRDAGFCKHVHEGLMANAPDAVGFFWRGMGRCLYFHPNNFMPPFGSRAYRALSMAQIEAPTPELRQSLYAGMAWALTVVNMMSPEVMEWVLENAWKDWASQPGFVNGITSSTVMRHDTTPGEPLIEKFMNHRPANPKIAELWETVVRASMKFAIQQVHPTLKRHQRLDEIFTYQSLPELVQRLGVA